MNATEPESYQQLKSLPARLVGVVRSPRVLFASLATRPTWADVLLATLLVTAACGMMLMGTGEGRQALVDQWERTSLAFGREVGDAQYRRFQDLSRHGVAYAALMAIVNGPVATFFIAAIIYGVYSGVQRGGVTYRQVLAVAAHAGVILAMRQLVATPFHYTRETLASPTTLGRLFPMLDEASPAARFLGAIDLFVVWWVFVLAIGVALLYRRPARPTVLTFMGAYVGLAAVLAIAMWVSGGTV
jgi:hypothetical protein